MNHNTLVFSLSEPNSQELDDSIPSDINAPINTKDPAVCAVDNLCISNDGHYWDKQARYLVGFG